MKEEFKNRFLYLKFDCATRLRVNYLGLNVRFVDDQGLGITRTLAVVDTESRHTSSELKEIINGVLQDYDIPLANIICCVMDNATNMVKLVSMMNKDLQQNEEVESETEENETLPGTLKLNVGIEEASVFDDSGEECNINLTQPPTVTRQILINNS